MTDLSRVVAHRDPSLAARVVRRVPMRYAAGADLSLDRPAHVRAASGLAWVGSRLAVVQDDASFIALVDPRTGLADGIVLPAGEGGRRLFDDGRGNKAHKLDLEALASVGEGDALRLLAIGSGSTSRRESIAIVSAPGTARAAVRLVSAPAFYAALRDAADFAGSELNVEGAVFVGGRLRLFGRGNGARRGELRPVNATCDVDWSMLDAHLDAPALAVAPRPSSVAQYELGAIDGAPLTFTDATLAWAAGGAAASILYLAAAEASPDVTRDGAVAGSAIGIIVERDGVTTARWTPLLDERGAPLRAKVEGIALGDAASGRVLVAVDVDAHDQPSELLEVELGGFLARVQGVRALEPFNDSDPLIGAFKGSEHLNRSTTLTP